MWTPLSAQPLGDRRGRRWCAVPSMFARARGHRAERDTGMSDRDAIAALVVLALVIASYLLFDDDENERK